MAAAVARAMEARSDLLVEAGTGVGKSFAYLVPAVLRCLKGERVVIATNTIALQEQLVAKDIPLVRGALEAVGIIPVPKQASDEEDGDEAPASDEPYFKPVLVKGRGNYVSIRRLKLASDRQVRLFGNPAALKSLHVIEDWAKETLDGTLSTLPPLERPGVWDKVQSDSGNCMGRKCPQYKLCFYQRARREMETANLLVCNHALFFSDLALRHEDVGFLPEYQHVILDEAHGVEDVAAEHFGLSLSEGRVMHLLTSLYQGRGAKGYLPHLQQVAADAAMVERAIGLVLTCENGSRNFFDALVRLQREGHVRNGRIREASAIANTLTPPMRELSLCLKNIREKIKNEPDRYELNAYSLRAAEMADGAEALVAQSLPGCAYWIESGGEDGESLRGGRFRRITLACSPIEVGPILKEKLFAGKVSVTLTSATLATGASAQAGRAGNTDEDLQLSKHGDDSVAAERDSQDASEFAHIKSRLGCEAADTLRLGSPFDHAAQMELYIERSMPRPEGGQSRRPARDELDQRTDDESSGGAWIRRAPPVPTNTYNETLATRILSHIDSTDGGAFVLFTSFATLNSVADALGPDLARREMPMLVQGRDGPRMQLLERFRQNDRSVLLGAASFWQGVDVRGKGLRNVIITRLPFEPPDRPLTEARLEKIKERGGDGFYDESLPRAVIRFKQGFGRLIRSKTDMGRVVVLDPRIVTTEYGKRFLEALPDAVKVIES
jgi:ATP-dependent DNA helicase DinG